MEEEKKYKNKYMLAYYYPVGTKKLSFIELNAATLSDALLIAKCVFGQKAGKHLYVKKVEV
jgi:hypothetical protein